MSINKDGRYEIHVSSSSDHFMAKEIDWEIIEIGTGRCVERFSGSFDGAFSGTKDVSFSDDGTQLKIKNCDGKVEVRPIE